MTVPAKVRTLVKERAGYCCEKCGQPGEALNIHHRKGRGGPDSSCPSNLMYLCGSGTTGCHGWVTANPLAAEAGGFSVRRLALTDPAAVPVLLGAYGTPMLLTPHGTYQPVCSPLVEQCCDQSPCRVCPKEAS